MVAVEIPDGEARRILAAGIKFGGRKKALSGVQQHAHIMRAVVADGQIHFAVRVEVGGNHTEGIAPHGMRHGSAEFAMAFIGENADGVVRCAGDNQVAPVTAFDVRRHETREPVRPHRIIDRGCERSFPSAIEHRDSGATGCRQVHVPVAIEVGGEQVIRVANKVLNRCLNSTGPAGLIAKGGFETSGVGSPDSNIPLSASRPATTIS